MGRAVCVVVVLAALSAWFLWPQPWITPHWEKRFARALEQGDCRTAMRLLEGARWSRDNRAFAHLSGLYDRGACGLGKAPQKAEEFRRISIMAARAENGRWLRETNLARLNFVRMRIRTPRDFYTLGLEFDKAGFAWRCWAEIRSDPFTKQDNKYLWMALQRPDLNARDIARAAKTEADYCAGRAVRLAQMLQAAYPDDPLGRSDVDALLTDAHARMTPLAGDVILGVDAAWAAREARLAPAGAAASGMRPSQAQPCSRAAAFEAGAAGRCAQLRLNAAIADPALARASRMDALYYALRARRLIGAAPEQIATDAAGALGPDCVAAIAQAEAADFSASKDHYLSPPYPFTAPQALAAVAACRPQSAPQAPDANEEPAP